jgi:hypothetical protein
VITVRTKPKATTTKAPTGTGKRRIVRTSVKHPLARSIMKELEGKQVKTIYSDTTIDPKLTYKVVFVK